MGKEGNQLERSEDQHSDRVYVYLKARSYFSMDSLFLLCKREKEREKERENILYIIKLPAVKAGVGVASFTIAVRPSSTTTPPAVRFLL